MQCERGRWNMKIGVVVAADTAGQTKEDRLQEWKDTEQVDRASKLP